MASKESRERRRLQKNIRAQFAIEAAFDNLENTDVITPHPFIDSHYFE